MAKDATQIIKKPKNTNAPTTIDLPEGDNNKYTKNENKIIYQDIQDCLVLVTNCFSTIGCFENQTKKSVNSKFTQEAMTSFFKDQLQVWFLENKQEADRAAEQILINKRARESAEKTKSNIKKNLVAKIAVSAAVFSIDKAYSYRIPVFLQESHYPNGVYLHQAYSFDMTYNTEEYLITHIDQIP